MRAAVAGAVALALASGACAAALAPAAPAVTPEGVRFTLRRPGAASVAVAGSFNQWSAVSHPLAPQGNSGLWTALVALPPGEHLFMYVVDGSHWTTPPLADDYVEDGFGSRNGIVVVRSEER